MDNCRRCDGPLNNPDTDPLCDWCDVVTGYVGRLKRLNANNHQRRVVQGAPGPSITLGETREPASEGW